MDYLLVLIPHSLKNSISGFLVGLYSEPKDKTKCRSLFIFGIESNANCDISAPFYPTIGHYNNEVASFVQVPKKATFIILSYFNEFIVNSVHVKNELVDLSKCHIIVFDDDTLIKSELFLPLNYRVNGEGDHFKALAHHLKEINRRKVNVDTFVQKCIVFVIIFMERAQKVASRCYRISRLTTLGGHYRQSFENLLWLLKTFRKEGKVTLKTGNYLVSLVIDLISGYLVLSYVVEYQTSTDLFNSVASYTENIIHSIEFTVKWLMGSPWGVKLNYPLNYILGNFFLYNIQLWWTFLGLSRPFLEVSFFAFLKLGLLGLSHQIAIIADVFSIVSFHVYCIYIYAAKLYYWQVSGLHSLSRIFLGRQRNPEPGKVDSCPYTTEQLFVGTICFTVLLFLLPTTLVYYVVFTLMRVVVNIVAGVMSRARYYIQALPLFCTVIWIFDPKFTSTTMKLVPVCSLSVAGVVTVNATRANTSWYDLYLRCKPEVIKQPSEFKWNEIGWSVLVGNLIYPV